MLENHHSCRASLPFFHSFVRSWVSPFAATTFFYQNLQCSWYSFHIRERAILILLNFPSSCQKATRRMLQYFPFTPLSEGTFVHAALYFLFSIDRCYEIQLSIQHWIWIFLIMVNLFYWKRFSALNCYVQEYSKISLNSKTSHRKWLY